MGKTAMITTALLTVILASLALAGCGDTNDTNSEYDELLLEKAALEMDVQTLQNFCRNLQIEEASILEEYNAVNDELTAIKAVYPPRDFASVAELEEWLLANDVSEKSVTSSAEAWYGRALEIQEDALKDGYIVSPNIQYEAETDMYLISCVAVINGDIWVWSPDDDEPIYYTGLGKVK